MQFSSCFLNWLLEFHRSRTSQMICDQLQTQSGVPKKLKIYVIEQLVFFLKNCTCHAVLSLSVHLPLSYISDPSSAMFFEEICFFYYTRAFKSLRVGEKAYVITWGMPLWLGSLGSCKSYGLWYFAAIYTSLPKPQTQTVQRLATLGSLKSY